MTVQREGTMETSNEIKNDCKRNGLTQRKFNSMHYNHLLMFNLPSILALVGCNRKPWFQWLKAQDSYNPTYWEVPVAWAPQPRMSPRSRVSSSFCSAAFSGGSVLQLAARWLFHGPIQTWQHKESRAAFFLSPRGFLTKLSSASSGLLGQEWVARPLSTIPANLVSFLQLSPSTLLDGEGVGKSVTPTTTALCFYQ